MWKSKSSGEGKWRERKKEKATWRHRAGKSCKHSNFSKQEKTIINITANQSVEREISILSSFDSKASGVELANEVLIVVRHTKKNWMKLSANRFIVQFSANIDDDNNIIHLLESSTIWCGVQISLKRNELWIHSVVSSFRASHYSPSPLAQWECRYVCRFFFDNGFLLEGSEKCCWYQKYTHKFSLEQLAELSMPSSEQNLFS